MVSVEGGEYEPYIESTINVELPEGEFIAEGDTLSIEYNEEDGENHLYLDKNIGEAIFDGDETYTLHNTNALGIANFGHKLSYLNSASDKIKCSHFIYSYLPINETTKECILWQSAYNYVYFRINSDKASTVEEFKTWLAENNVKVLYNLANPYRIDLGVVNQLKTYSDETNVFTDSELQPNIYMLYNRNFKTTVRNLQVNEGKLQEELANLESRLASLEASLNSLAQTTSLLEEETK